MTPGQNYDPSYPQSNPGNMRDIVLNPHEYCFIQDLNTGTIKVIVGPKKVTLQPTDKTVTYNAQGRLFQTCTDLADSKKSFPYADETSYLVLKNPSLENKHPNEKMENEVIELNYGRTINLAGPTTFALWPGQDAMVVKGHRLRSNQYLLVRVINDLVAKENFEKTVVQTTDEVEANMDSLKNFKLTTGALNIIKGTDVSFYIPPTGIEVVKENERYVREALTLERLKYCILVDESGQKRYMKGPDVVFPEPTEQFVKKDDGSTIYIALELNENMGLYVKVVDGYEEEGKSHKVGEELFITGKEQKIYFPRVEHEIIKYGSKVIHYATVIPKGEGCYVLNKHNGEIKTEVGSQMFLPNPIEEVIVKRALDKNQAKLWFPGNIEAMNYNESLKRSKSRPDMTQTYSTVALYSEATNIDDEIRAGIDRKTSYTKPRMIELDTKYAGAVVINVWPGYAVQVVGRTGERKVVVGPKAVILDYDQVLEVLAMSTGRPKSDDSIERTVYLKVMNNTVTDEISAQTNNLVDVKIFLSYKVHFENEPEKWFEVENYVKLLTENCRSIIRNMVKKYGVEEFNERAEDLIRDCILGKSMDGSHKGKSFEENNMRVYDLDILSVVIGDQYIANMIMTSQHNTVKTALELKTMVNTLKEVEAKNQLDQGILVSNQKIAHMKYEEDKVLIERIQVLTEEKNAARLSEQEALDSINKSELLREAERLSLRNADSKEILEMEVDAFRKKFEAISPQLVEALLTIGNNDLVKELVANLPDATGTTGFLLGRGGVDGLMSLVGGTKLEESIKNALKEK